MKNRIAHFAGGTQPGCRKGGSGGRLLLLLLMILCMHSPGLKAGQVEWNNRISGSQLAPGAILYLSDDLFPMPMNDPNWYADMDIYSAQSRVSLGIDRLSLKMESVDIDVKVKVRFTGFDKDFNQTVWEDDLLVHYDGNQSGEKEQMLDFRVREGMHYVVVRVLNVTVSGVATNPDFIYLESALAVDRTIDDWKNKWNTIDDNWSVVHEYLPEQTQLEIRWDFIEGAEEYELEWTFVHSKDGQNFYGTTDLGWDFRHDGTRIQTTHNVYRLPMRYEAGYLVYRLRAIHTIQSGDAVHRIPSEWTSTRYNPTQNQEQGSMQDLFNAIPGNANQFWLTWYGSDLNKNWQFSSQYAEEGKHIAGISFFDGTLRTRQTVTKNNADSTVAVGETYYDHQGRAAVQALPVPAINGTNPQLRFFNGEFSPGNGFNLAANNADAFDKSEFDTSPNCDVTAEPMGNGNGAG
ncbi:MAG: hypothetical protein AAF570_18530, partial [Bacteroidota bacterium]